MRLSPCHLSYFSAAFLIALLRYRITRRLKQADNVHLMVLNKREVTQLNKDTFTKSTCVLFSSNKSLALEEILL